jgi:ribosomal protein L37E
MIDIKKVWKAWVTSYRPTQQQSNLAVKRVLICNRCPSMAKYLNIDICSECGCPISKKVFTNEYNACPLKKWGNIDKEYFKV